MDLRGGSALFGPPAPWVSALILCAAGCAGSPEAAPRGPTVWEKLAGLGLELVTEREALVPPAERGKLVPCRVVPGFPAAALPDDPAGYLILGIEGGPSGDTDGILRAIERAAPGETLILNVRRNTYLEADPSWWEGKVKVRIPSLGMRAARAGK